MTDLYIGKIDYNEAAIKRFKEEILRKDKEERFPVEFPSVYIGEVRNGRNSRDSNLKEAYVGETNWIVQRTLEHLKSTNEDKLNQLSKKGQVLLYIIAHKLFNKSATIVNRTKIYGLSIRRPEVFRD
ncbi:hypothetical protein [Weissella halotolerans]|uniref:hypothetical protein n=1 Tax=Weissella halotolerans TaxID=1615 RepID=UPI0003B44BCD|nr:hypothetical protein [Weissella halotolerans]